MSALAQHQLHRDGGGEVPIADGYCEGAVAVSRAASEGREGGFLAKRVECITLYPSTPVVRRLDSLVSS